MKKKGEKLINSNNELLTKNKIFKIKILKKGKSYYNLAKLLSRIRLIINGLRFYSPKSL